MHLSNHAIHKLRLYYNIRFFSVFFCSFATTNLCKQMSVPFIILQTGNWFLRRFFCINNFLNRINPFDVFTKREIIELLCVKLKKFFSSIVRINVDFILQALFHCFSVPLSWLISQYLWNGFWWNLSDVLKVMSNWLYKEFTCFCKASLDSRGGEMAIVNSGPERP